MPGNLSGPTLVVILFIVLLLFGAPKLPALARSLGQSMKILKKEVSTDDTGKENGASEEAPVVDEAAQAKADLEQARAEAAQAKAEAEALRQQAQQAPPESDRPQGA